MPRVGPLRAARTMLKSMVIIYKVLTAESVATPTAPPACGP